MSEGRQRVVLVRHGETEWSATGKHTGRTDVPLTDEGRRQAAALGACLKEWTLALILTSPLQRAVETCRLAGLGDRAEVRENLREWDYGEYEGRTTPEIRRDRPGWSLWTDGVPGGESLDQLSERADRVIIDVRAVGGDVALFSHGHFLRVLAARWVDLAADRGRNFALSTATVSVLGYERETPVVARWNQRC